MPEPLKPEPIVLDIQDVLERTEYKWPGWWENFAQNLPIIRAGKNVSDMPKRNGPAIIVGAGPSLIPKHLRLLRDVQKKFGIIAADRTLKPLLQVGIHPTVVATVDGDPSIASFYDMPAKATVSVLSGVTTHPSTVKKAQANTADVFWFISFFDDPLLPKCAQCRRVSPTAAFHFMSGRKMILQALGNVGALCWHLGYFLGYNPLIMIGMDYSYPPNTPIATTHYYDAYLKIAAQEHIGYQASQPDIEGHVKTCLKCRQRVKDSYEVHTNPDFKEDYMTDKIWTVYKQLVMPFIARAKVRTINSSGGALHGPGISSIPFDQAIAKYAS